MRVVNILELLDRVKDEVAAPVKKPFGRTVACYYGCLLVRPPRVVASDRPEDPTSMDAMVAAAGGKTVRWSFKTECCGAGLSLPRTSTVAKLAGRIVKDATDRKAEAIVVACPMCHSNLDLRRGQIEAALGGRPASRSSSSAGGRLALGLPRRSWGSTATSFRCASPSRRGPPSPWPASAAAATPAAATCARTAPSTRSAQLEQLPAEY